jgi:hypothetical protein
MPLVMLSYPAPWVDDFSNPASGWYTGAALRYNDWCRWGIECHEGWEEVAYMSYLDGHYRIYVPLTWQGMGDVDTWFVWPAEMAPLPEYYYPLPENYCIETMGRFANRLGEDSQPYSAHWGIVFGANRARTEVYTAQVNANLDYATLRLHNYVYPGNRQPLSGEEVNVEIPLATWTGGYHWELLATHGNNILRVEVHGDTVRYIINGQLRNTLYVPDLPRDRIGLIGGSWEVTPVDIMIDYFRYEPNCPE